MLLHVGFDVVGVFVGRSKQYEQEVMTFEAVFERRLFARFFRNVFINGLEGFTDAVFLFFRQTFYRNRDVRVERFLRIFGLLNDDIGVLNASVLQGLDVIRESLRDENAGNRNGLLDFGRLILIGDEIINRRIRDLNDLLRNLVRVELIKIDTRDRDRLFLNERRVVVLRDGGAGED